VRSNAGAIATGIFRANPDYELVLLDRLVDVHRKLLAGLDSEDLYGVLRPRAGVALEPRSASTDTALLFLTLAEPAELPGYVRKRLGDNLERTIARLVVDQVIEIEHDGRFVSGSRAVDLVLAERSAGGRGRIAELSIAALRYGQELALPVDELTLRLYNYGRRPASAVLTSKLPGPHAVDVHLGLAPDGAAAKLLATGWLETTTPDARPFWRSWRARSALAAESGLSDAGYKLYVSPTLEALPRAVEAVASSFPGRGAKAFKVGSGLGGLCRPDKLVVYFDRLDDLRDAATTLDEKLQGCAAHGVPFTASIDKAGLLSWGADPPTLGFDTGGVTSWRLWVCERLADYLSTAIADRSDGIEPWQFALERLRLAGIDTDTWVPASGMWREAREHA
jgi:hypothetical protein